MVLALVHPLVQVYTIPETGQLAYVWPCLQLPAESGFLLVFSPRAAARYALRDGAASSLQETAFAKGAIQNKC